MAAEIDVESVPAHLANMARGRVYRLDELTPLPGNPNRGDVDAVKASLRRFGQKKPIVVDADGVIVAGNTTRAAAGELVDEGETHWEQLWGVLDTETDPQELLAYSVADNRTARRGEDDPALMLARLGEIEDHTALGYDETDLALLRAAAEADAAPVPDFQPTGDGDQPRLDESTPITCPSCGHSWRP